MSGWANSLSTDSSNKKSGGIKMNSYYHEFVPGFNWWYIVAPVLILVMAIVGWQRYKGYRKPRSLEIRRGCSDKFLKIVAWIFTAVVTALIFLESADGIVQFFDNIAPASEYESALGSVFYMSFFLTSFVFIYWGLLVLVGRLAANIKYALLCQEREKREKVAKKKDPRV